MKDIFLVSGAHIINRFPRHVHEEYCLGALHDGRRELCISGEIQSIGKGDIYIINPGEAHSSESSDTSESYSVLAIRSGALKKNRDDQEALPRFQNVIRDQERLYREFLSVFDLLQSGTSSEEKESALYAFLAKLLTDYAQRGYTPGKPDNPPLVTHLKAYIEKHFRELLSLERLSDDTGYSPFYLHNVFTRSMGISPRDFQMQKRIDHSKTLLRQGISLIDAGLEAGFSDQSHFTRCFKKITGITPGRYIACNISKSTAERNSRSEDPG